MTTTQKLLIQLRWNLKGPLSQVNKDLYTNFQSILNFHKNLLNI